MADSSVAITAGAGTAIDTRTESINGDHRQVVVIGDPVTGANVAQVSAAGALYIQGYQGAITTLNVTTSSSTTGSIVASNYNIAMVSIHGTHAGINLTWEISDDGGTTWYGVQAQRDDTGAVATTSGVVTSNASWSWTVPIGAATHFRVRSTAFTSGTGVVGVSMQSMPYEPIPSVFVQGTVPVSGTVTATVPITATAALADGFANPTTGQLAADNMTYNGATWERQRSGSYSLNVDTSSARTTTGNGTAWVNYGGARGMWVWINVTAVSGTTPTCVFKLQWSPDNGTTWIDWDTTNLQTTSLTGVTTAVLKVSPHLTNTANSIRQDTVPRQVRLAWTITGTTPSFTFATWYTAAGS